MIDRPFQTFLKINGLSGKAGPTSMDVEQHSKHHDSSSLSPHELGVLLQSEGCRLNDTLVEMLGEHFTHCTERRGCGFTQATRHLAVLVNRPLSERRAVIGKLFPDWAKTALREPLAEVNSGQGSGGGLAPLREVLRDLPATLAREESRLLAAIIADLVMPGDGPPSAYDVAPYDEEIKVGTCTLAERFFLEICYGHVRRAGRINVHVSDHGEPLMIEKLNLGDDHSCISLVELRLHGVRLPPGSLLAVRRSDDIAVRPCAKLPGSVMRMRDCDGYRFLRLATLAVTPAHRRRAFTAHFQAQIDACLLSPGQATLEQLRGVALEQL